MIKCIAVTAAALLVALVLSGLGASGASAATCYEISKFENIDSGGPESKGGSFEDDECTEERTKLTGEFALIKKLRFKTVGILYCAELALIPEQKQTETGYYEKNNCTLKNKETKANKSDFTEVEVPVGKASALPEFSPTTGGSATSGEGTLSLESTKVTCKSDTAKLGAITAVDGTFAIDFKECKSVGEECKGLAQSAGIVELTGEWYLVSQKANRKSFDILFLLAAEDSSSAVHIECSSPAGTLILVWGGVLGSIEASPSTSERTFKINVETEGAGSTLKQKIKEFGNNEGETVKPGLKGRVDGGTEREAFEASKEDLLSTEKPTKILET
jgi:hypothetical protein